ncbi:MAG TPA: T9SS type A sorting domain-containing protein [Puia sp.]|nr:T9SS type A sorting domain-containing protein [Puia sp.]
MWKPRTRCLRALYALDITLRVNSLWLISLLVFPAARASAQCGGYVQKQVYTQTYTSNGGSTYTMTVPQYDPPTGYSLTAAVYSSAVTTSASLGLQNTTHQEQDFTPDISRSDLVKLNGVSTTGKNLDYGNYNFTDLSAAGSPGDNISYGPDLLFNSVPSVYDSVINAATLAARYQGTGSNTLSYSTTFFINDVPIGVTPTPAISDQVAFSFTYYICSPAVLSSDLLNFTATKQNALHTLLKWSVVNESPGRVYTVEVSPGGSDFVDIGSVPSLTQGSSADYSYTYSNQPGATGKLYFRIKQVDVGGSTTFSNICVVDLGDSANAAFTIFPNPSVSGNFISLSLPGDSRSWQVEIFSAEGNLVQKNVFTDLSLVTVNFNSPMAAGAYFVRAVNPLSGDVHTGSFLVRR